MFERLRKKKKSPVNSVKPTAGTQLNDGLLEAAAGGTDIWPSSKCVVCGGTGINSAGEPCTNCKR